MLVAVFRALDDGRRTAERLRVLGHDALLAPVLDVVPTGEPVPAGPFDGVIFTSAHGVEALPARDAVPLLGLPCFCVGDRTAICAGSAGFTDLRSGRADAERLAAIVCTAFTGPVRLLLVAGRDRKPAIEATLATAGHAVSVAELYQAKAVERWGGPVEAAFQARQVGAALHYSRRSAGLALQCAEAASLSKALLDVRHCCLSEDAAAPLRQACAWQIAVAAEPNEDSVLALLTADKSSTTPVRA